MSDILIEPEVADPETSDGEPRVAHIVKKEDQMQGYINGKRIEALCGKKWIPSRDFEGLPVCEPCKAVARAIVLSQHN